MSGSSAERAWVLWLIVVAALGVLVYSVLGYIMAASMSVADSVPGQRTSAAYVYVGLFIVSALAIVAGAIALVRRRSRARSNHRSTAA